MTWGKNAFLLDDRLKKSCSFAQGCFLKRYGDFVRCSYRSGL